MTSEIDPEQFTKPFLLTQAYHRDPYPAISPENPSNKQDGKIIIITGASSGIGEVSQPSLHFPLHFNFPCHFLSSSQRSFSH
jgi:hypothetical protein